MHDTRIFFWHIQLQGCLPKRPAAVWVSMSGLMICRHAAIYVTPRHTHRNCVKGTVTPFKSFNHSAVFGKISDFEAMQWIDNLHG